MRCQDIERLIIESTERTLSQEERYALDGHVRTCDRCLRFQSESEQIRLALQRMPAFSIPERLDRETLRLCRVEKGRIEAEAAVKGRRLRVNGIPKYIWAALFGLIALTVMFFVVALGKIDQAPVLSFTTSVVLTLFLQNAVMLILAPLIFKKFLGHKRSFERA